jgi:hypothetical protein
MRISKASTTKYQYVFDFSFSYEVLNFCRALKSRYGSGEFGFEYGNWRFNSLKFVDLILSRFPQASIDANMQYDMELYEVVKKEEKLHQERAQELKTATTTDFKVNNVKLELRPYQKIGVEFFINSGGRAILADQMGCISGDADIIVNRGGGARHYRLEDVYLRTKSPMIVGGWSKNIQSYTRSYDEKTGELRLNKIIDIIDSGIKDVVELIAISDKREYRLKLTPDHKVITPGGEWVQIQSLSPGDKILVNGKIVEKKIKFCKKCGRETEHVTYKYAKFFGKCKICIYKDFREAGFYRSINNPLFVDKDGYLRVSKNVSRHPNYKKQALYYHVLAMEAYLNGISTKEWLNIIKENKFTQKHIFIDSTKLAVHHIDGNKKNNEQKNLRLMTHSEHAKLEGEMGNYSNFSSIFLPDEATIISIHPIGKEHVYDIAMEYPQHSFVASGVIVHNSGKTAQALAFVAHQKIKRTVVVCPSSVKYVWESEAKKFTDLKTYVINSHNNPKTILNDIAGSDIVIINYDILKKFTAQLLNWKASCICYDECFTGETEVLTNEGFKRFDSLSKKELIAQWDDGEISFVKPIRHIKREHDGEMTSFKIKHDKEILMTPQHDQVIINKKDGRIRKIPISECVFRHNLHIPTSGFSIERSGELTPLERMYIATQADGSIHYRYNNHTTVAFTFTKQRKIDRIKRILKDAKLEYSEVKHSNRHAIRLMVKMPVGTTKDITKHIKYPMSGYKAMEIIEEMVEWDGSRLRGGYQYYFSSKDKKQVDFYSQVAVLAGHTCYQFIEKDNRKENYSDIHRLSITINKQSRGTQQMETRSVYYKGMVYCVEVPSGAIVVRHKGVTFVSGNCHYIKSIKAKRTRLARILSLRVPNVLLLSGTPFLNRPVELFTSLQIIDPNTWRDWYAYTRQYCAGRQTSWGYDASGASHIDELHAKIAPYFLRRLKSDILKELPPKQFIDVPVELSPDILDQYRLAENSFIEFLRKVKKKDHNEIMRSLQAEKLTKLNALRQLTTAGKESAAKEIIENIIDEDEKVVVFSVYNQPLENLKNHFGNKAVMITGKTTAAERDGIVSKFQQDPKVKVFLGGTISAGVGITLTAASNVLFVDFDWVPANHKQAEDRIHRIGQTAESVNIYQLVSKGTIDEKMQAILARKQKLFDRLIDGIETEDIKTGQFSMINDLLKEYEK